MPRILKRLVNQLKQKGMNDQSAHAVAVSKLQDYGILKEGSSEELTAKGKTRNSMTASERAKDRASKHSKHDKEDYKYSKKTNRATLK